jgi:hypothetical protein
LSGHPMKERRHFFSTIHVLLATLNAAQKVH